MRMCVDEGEGAVKRHELRESEQVEPHMYLSGSHVSSFFLALVAGSFFGMAFDFLVVVAGVVVEGGEGLLPAAAGVEGVEARLMASVAGKRRRRARRTRMRRREETKLRLCSRFLEGGNSGGRPPVCGPP